MLDLLTLDTKTLLKSALTRLHRHAFSNQAEIRRSTICRCFRCRSEFHRLDVVRWAVRTWRGQPVFPGPQPLDTAECPRCGQLAVIGDACGYEISPALLKELALFHATAVYDLQFDCSWVHAAEARLTRASAPLPARRPRPTAHALPAAPAARKKGAVPPAPPSELMPMAGYVRFKAARFLRDGHDLYRRTDAFRQPPEDTPAEDLALLRIGFQQLVDGRGFLRAAPLEHLGVHGLHLLMQVAHFTPLRQRAAEQGEYFLDAVVFRHRDCGRVVTVFNLVPPTDIPDELRRLLASIAR
jgi:hypothetical protein